MKIFVIIIIFIFFTGFTNFMEAPYPSDEIRTSPVQLTPLSDASQPFDDLDTISMRFYRYVYDKSYAEILAYIPIDIPADNWRKEIPQLMLRHSDIHVLDLWLEGGRLYVDLCPECIIFFDMGSFSGYAMTTALVNSLASLPLVEEIFVLVDGAEGHYGSHFDFRHVFIIQTHLP